MSGQIWCPECSSVYTVEHAFDVVVGGGFRTKQNGRTCIMCAARWSSAAECQAADERLIAQGWKPRGGR